MTALMAGFPNTVPGVQLNRMCGSAQQAVHFAAQAIASGDMDLAIGGGVEMMVSAITYLLLSNLQGTVKMGSDSDLLSGKTKFPIQKLPFRVLHQGQSAELIAEKYGISKEELDQVSHYILNKLE